MTQGASQSEKRALAEALQPELVAAFGYNDRGVKEDYTANPAQGHLTVLRQTEIIAALTEASFIDNQNEENLMAYDPDHRLDEATAIRDGVVGYVATIGVDPNFLRITSGNTTKPFRIFTILQWVNIVLEWSSPCFLL